MVRTPIVWTAALSLAFGVGSGLVLAAESAAPAATSAEANKPKDDKEEKKEQKKANERDVEEITVTSRRINENIQDVPLAVTAFDAEFIKKVAPRTLRDFDGLAPNVRIGMNTAGPSAGAIFIRGIGYADIEKTQAPAVSVIIDGVQQGSNTGQLIDAFNIAQIEVNRGPQGVLQGKNTTGGAVVVTRIRPQFDEWGGSLSGQVGSYQERQVKGLLNIPIMDDQLAANATIIRKTRDGFYKNLTLGNKPGEIDYTAATAKLRWEPTESFGAELTWDYVEDSGQIPPQDPRYNGKNPFTNEANIKEPQKYDVNGWTLNMNYDVGIGTLTSTTGLQYANDTVRQDFDGSSRFTNAIPLVQLHTLRAQNYRQFSEELKLSGDLIENQLQYIVGAFYWDTHHKHLQGTNLVLQLPLGLPPGVPCSVVPGFINNPIPAIGNALCQLGPSFSFQFSGEEVKSRALFASLTYNPIESVEIHGGIRFLDEEKEFHSLFGLAQAPGGPLDQFGAPLLAPDTLAGSPFAGFPVTGNHSWNDTVYEISAKWQVTDESNLYASYRQGFRSGGYSLRATDPSRLTYDPENVNQWEIGTKNEFLDGFMRLNLAGFITTLEGAQFSSILNTTSLPGTNTLILNATGDFDVWGIEAEALFRLTDNLTVQLTYGKQHTEGGGDTHSCLERVFNTATGTACNPAENPALFAPGAGPLPNVTVAKGGQGFAAPDFNYAIVTAWDQDIGPGHFHADVIVRATDDVFLFTRNGQPAYQDGYTLTDASISYRWTLGDRSSLEAKLSGKNLLDRQYIEQELELGSGGFRGWGPPRQVALEVSYQQ